MDEFSKEYSKEESSKKFDPPSTESPSSCSCPFILALLILIAVLAFLLGFLGGSAWSSNRCLRSCMAELNGQRIAMEKECKDKGNLELQDFLKEMELKMRHLEKELNTSKDENKRLHQSSRECTEDYDRCKDQKLTCLADLLKSQEDAKRKKEDLAACQLEKESCDGEVSKLQKGLEKKEEELEQCKENKKECEDNLEACLIDTKKKEKECDEDKKKCHNDLSICLVDIKAIKVKLDTCDKEKIECESKPHKKPCNKRRKHHHHHRGHHHHHHHHHH